ncbi:teichoic acid biosynthesis glycosyltransferase [Fibrobacterales bacterium]|nr:teichoic acid biosynthesis glycosyltransferase [Fibrobacterales bacterium]
MSHKEAHLLGIRLFHEGREAWLSHVASQLNGESLAVMHTVNLEIFSKALKDSEYRKILQCAEWSVVDGYPVSFIAWLKNRVWLKRICGSDFIYDLLSVCQKENKRILILGGTSKRNELAVLNIKKRYPNLDVSGYSPEFPSSIDIHQDSELQTLIEQFKPAVIAVCFGAPKQEMWMEGNREFLIQNGVRLVAGLGGVVDFLSGEIKRAPGLFRRFGMEWLWRCLLEPHRFKRYAVAMWIMVRYGKQISRRETL